MFPLRNNHRWHGWAAVTVVGLGLVGIEIGQRLQREGSVSWKGEKAIAHQVEIAGDVGGTIHIEPNDTPKAGESSLAWFALTKRGGESIPLADCDCNLDIYHAPYSPGDKPFSCPDFRAVSSEGYEGIPGADVTFPEPGSYDLVVTGKPTTTGTFESFELTFSVTVAR